MTFSLNEVIKAIDKDLELVVNNLERELFLSPELDFLFLKKDSSELEALLSYLLELFIGSVYHVNGFDDLPFELKPKKIIITSEFEEKHIRITLTYPEGDYKSNLDNPQFSAMQDTLYDSFGGSLEVYEMEDAVTYLIKIKTEFKQLFYPIATQKQ